MAHTIRPAAMRFALEHQNPLVSARISGGGGGTAPADKWSLISLPSNDVALWALKPSEEGIEKRHHRPRVESRESPRALDLALAGHVIESARQHDAHRDRSRSRPRS